MSATAELIDTHCHLGHDGEDPGIIVARAHAAGVVAMLDVGIDLATSQRAASRAASHEGVRFACGIHPNAASRWQSEGDAIAALAADPRCAAVGETGLDFHWNEAPHDVQRAAFQAQLELGVRLDKPVVVHARKALAEVLDVIASHPRARVVLHCFSGDERDAARAVGLGCHVSFAGPITYPKADALRRAARVVPGKLLLVETDAPFLPPQSRRGGRNEPALVVEIAERLARERDEDFAVLAARTTANARALFGF
ncbi:MAG: TatD family hydrolase [Planctomycetes bacterium]|nr:TatD family hydrolase [Planctomycetota bacterium]